MFKFDFKPYEKIGNVLFGMNRNTVRNLLGEYEEFKKSEFSMNTTDAFGMVHIYYDENNCVEAVECFGDAEVLYEGKDLCKYEVDDFQEMFTDTILEEDGINIPSCGISCFVPDMKVERKIESILLYKKGYYEEA